MSLGSNEMVSYKKECSCCHQDPLSQKDNWGIIASIITSFPLCMGVNVCMSGCVSVNVSVCVSLSVFLSEFHVSLCLCVSVSVSLYVY